MTIELQDCDYVYPSGRKCKHLGEHKLYGKQWWVCPEHFLRICLGCGKKKPKEKLFFMFCGVDHCETDREFIERVRRDANENKTGKSSTRNK